MFSDGYGFCKEIVDQAPHGRIGTLNIQSKPANAYDEKTVKQLVRMHKWDLIIFAIGIDPPASNSVADLHKQQDAVAKMFLHLVRAIGDDPTNCKNMCVLTVDTFADEKEIHEECGT